MRWLVTLCLCTGCYLSHGLSSDDEGSVDAGRADVPGFDVPRLDAPRLDVASAPDADASPDVPPPSTSGVCCANSCGDELCALDVCGQVTRFVCGGESACTETFVDCDEGSDCAGDEVCRTEGDGRFRCLPALETCEGPLPSSECNYACSSDAECPAAAPQCLSAFAEPLGDCPSIGFCRPFR